MFCSKTESLRFEIVMLIASALWGTSYLFMKEGLSDMAPINLVCWRLLFAFVLPLPFMWKTLKGIDIKTLKYSAVSGAFLALILYLVAKGVTMTSASNASFLVGTAVVIVPILSGVFGLAEFEISNLIHGLIVVLGVWLMTSQNTFHGNPGDYFCMANAVIRALQIIFQSRISKYCNMDSLGLLQLAWGAVFSLLFNVGSGNFDIPDNPSDILCLLALGGLCTSVGFILQAKAQRVIPPTRLAIIFTTEPIFTAFFSLILFRQLFTIRQTLGAAIIFVGLLLSSTHNNK